MLRKKCGIVIGRDTQKLFVPNNIFEQCDNIRAFILIDFSASGWPFFIALGLGTAVQVSAASWDTFIAQHATRR